MPGCSTMSTSWTVRTAHERCPVVDKVEDTGAFSPLIGADILGLITAGMYHDPLALYREYVQNVADTVVDAGPLVRPTVEIDIDTPARSVRIRDNGPGLSHEAAVRALVPIARSQKRRGVERGFRGIGRLAGLAFAESVTFTTRAHGDRLLTRITWDGRKLRGNDVATDSTGRSIAECIRIETATAPDCPGHFFEVLITGVARHVAGQVMNREAVRAYVGEVCPVPFSPEFPFASEIDSLLGETRPAKLNVVLDGEGQHVTRRHGRSIRFARGQEACFTELEEVCIPALDGGRNAAIGWIAHSTYRGAIPREAGVRGIRARCGDVQVGDEGVFDRLFKEDRFNRWCVGEIHVLDPRIVPNGRRDYFELGPHVRHLENQLGPVVRRLSERCRNASLTRNRRRKLEDGICRLEDACYLATSGYLARGDSEVLASGALKQARDIRERIEPGGEHAETQLGQIKAVEKRLCNLQQPNVESVFGDASRLEIATYQRAFQALTAVARSPGEARALIESVLTRTRISSGRTP